jgi:O-antigen/teichoic acid export membrane protein
VTRYFRQSLASPSIFGILDQAVISAGNLLIGLLLIHLASKQSYGLYGIGYSVIQAGVGIANALVLTQMTVRAHEKESKEQYCLSMLIGLAGIVIIGFAVAGSVVAGLFVARQISNEHAAYISAIGLAIPGVLLLEYSRRLGYLRQSGRRVFLMDASFTLIFLIGVVGIAFLEQGLGHVAVLLTLGGAAALAGLTFLAQSRILSHGFRNPGATRRALSEAWGNGRWALLGVGVTWIQTQSYVYLLGIMLDAESVADANAARIFMAPAALVIVGINQAFLPRLAIIRSEQSEKAATDAARKMMKTVVAIVAVFASTVYVILEIAPSTMIPSGYQGLSQLSAIWGVAFVFQAIRSNSSMLLQAANRFKELAAANTICAFISVCVGGAAISVWGVHGALIGVALSECAMAISLSWIVKNGLQRN